jgi:hypothetical protein
MEVRVEIRIGIEFQSFISIREKQTSLTNTPNSLIVLPRNVSLAHRAVEDGVSTYGAKERSGQEFTCVVCSLPLMLALIRTTWLTFLAMTNERKVDETRWSANTGVVANLFPAIREVIDWSIPFNFPECKGTCYFLIVLFLPCLWSWSWDKIVLERQLLTYLSYTYRLDSGHSAPESRASC